LCEQDLNSSYVHIGLYNSIKLCCKEISQKINDNTS
jgi:hypothetical protein